MFFFQSSSLALHDLIIFNHPYIFNYSKTKVPVDLAHIAAKAAAISEVIYIEREVIAQYQKTRIFYRIFV